MATQLFFRNNDSTTSEGLFNENRGRNDAALDGGLHAGGGWNSLDLSLNRGAAALSRNRNTAAGPTAGLEIGYTSTSDPVLVEWLSPPLAAAVTISGTITFNLRMSENNMSANVGAQCVVERVDNTGAIISTVTNSEQGSELATSEAAQNWTVTPTSTSFNTGDRIRVRVCGNDGGGTMAATFLFTFFYNGTTAAATGDSWVQFTEAITFLATDPSAQTVYLGTATSDIVSQGASVDSNELWTGRGASNTAAVRDTAAGWTAPLQWTASSGGHTVEWYSRRLQAVTLAGLVKCNLWAAESSLSANCGMNAELAVVNNDGSGAVVFGSGGIIYTPGNIPLTTAARQIIYIAGQDIAITNGQRLRLRVRIDDDNSALVSGFTATLNYGATSGGVTGDSWIILPVTLSEFTAGLSPPFQGRTARNTLLRR